MTDHRWHIYHRRCIHCGVDMKMAIANEAMECYMEGNVLAIDAFREPMRTSRVVSDATKEKFPHA